MTFCRIGGNEPKHDDFRPRTLWSLSNAFTSAFKELDPIPVQGNRQAGQLLGEPVQTEILSNELGGQE